MFGWNIAKSAEAMLSRSVIRRLCKFLLKKKLGEFICGDIDLDQLDVQLGEGTIQLKDLALNVDYLNQKLHAAPVVVKEGSIGSLLVKIPWKLANCQIEVDGLELVLAPCSVSNVPKERDNVTSCQDGKQSVINGLEKVESATACGSSGSLSLEVHEGVKTIAKMVKWLLTSFHVKIKKLIVAFEPWLENDRERDKSLRTLVLCISEAEYGTCVSEDASSLSVSVADTFLGMSRLTNFIKFQGAVIELLQMDIVDNQLSVPTASGATFTDNHAESKSSGTRTPVLTGEVGGFSGNLKLSIPWKNGSLDINKVDADVHIDPLKFKLQPSTINWIICSWECLKDVGVDRSDMQHKTAESVCHNFSSCYQSFTQGSALTATSRVIPSSEKLSRGSCSLSSHAFESDYLLQGAHVIADWVPSSNNRCQKDGVEPEPDYGASIDQFFECFDGMRSSHAAALGHSGIWNWTCSVFSAITAASSLAAGSVHISPEQHHVETILRATVAGISVILSFHDENRGQSHDSQGGDGNTDCLDGTKNESCLTSDVVMSSTGSAVPVYSCMSSEQSTKVNSASVHYLEAMCRELVLSLQVCHKSIMVEAIIKHIEVDDCFTNGNIAGNFGFSGCEQSVHNEMILFQRLQADVQGALPPFSFSVQDANAEEMIFNPFHHEYMNGNLWEANQRASCHGDLVKIKLLKSVGMQDCQLAVSSTYIDNKSGASTSFSLDLPPFILWVDFSLVNLLFDLSKKVGTSLDTNNAKKDSVSVVLGGRRDSSRHGDLKSGTCTYIKDVTPRGSVRGNIFLPRTRIILCFPFEDHGDSWHCSSWDEFVCLDFSPSLSPKNVRDASPLPNVSFQKGYSDSPSNSISLNFGDLNIYLISPARGCGGGTGSISSHQTFSAENIFSATKGADGCHSVISMSWQGGPVTGSWIARKAWGVVTSQESRNRKKVTGKGYEFASVTTAEHLVETDSCVQQEMILSSAFVLHVHFSLVQISLGRSEYELLQSLLSLLSDGFKKEHGSVSDGNSSQVSVLIDCDVVNLSIKIEKGIDVNCSLQKELSGSWDSLRLVVEKFELLSVSNIGGINSANFFWVSHDEGELWGCFDEVSDDASAAFKEYLLISCRNSTIRRGDGEGTNALSSGSAGSVIMHLLDPQSFRSFTSITVRCGTIVAPGGRMDWVNEICNFFSLPSSENEQASTSSMQNGLPADHASFVASFCLDLVDIALSYEPYMRNPIVNDGDWESEGRTSDKPVEEAGELPVPCLLAASSLNLSNQTVSSLPSNEYKIILHDLGLLLCSSSGSENDRGIYSVDYLRRNGYVKVASEALVEAVLRTNCNNGLLWELECSESHVNIDTCCDTTAGLIRLAAQLQQLFAPDMKESIIHLQNRWNNIQQTHGHGSADATSTCESSSFASINGQTCHRDVDHRLGGVGLMDGVLEDAFYMNRNRNSPSNSGELLSHIELDVGLHGDAYSLDINTPTASDVFPGNVSLSSLMSGLGFENIQNPSSLQKSFYPDVVEGFYLPELCPPQASSNDYSPREVDLKLKSKNVDHLDMECGNSKWYEDNSLRIIEDHVSKISFHPAERQISECGKFPSVNSMTHDDSCKPCGRVILKNIDVKWRMYAGLDWPNLRKNVPHTMSTCGRDATVCLELTLSRMKMQYDMFPVGEIYVSSLSLSVQDFHLYDYSKDAPWKKVLGYYQSKKHPRESSTKAFKLDLEAVRPDPFTPLEEYRLRLAFLPIRLHLDQSQLDFLIGFFTRKESSNEQSPDVSNDLGGSRVSLEKSSSFAEQTIAQEALLPFFQKIDIWPAIVRVDYNPRHFDLTALRGGNYGELLNLVPLKGIELELKHVHAVGVYGWSNVCETVIGEWLEDISRNQVRKLLKGLPPIRSLVAVGSGAAKLVSLPVKNYRKDHRLLKGVQRGAIAFVRSVSLEAVGLGLHLAAGAHEILLQTECILANVPPSVPGSLRSRAATNVRTNQPKDVQQGIQQAYESISDGLGRTASSLVGNPIKTYQRGAGVGSALASAARAAPAAAIAPASATARAVHCALLGVRNSLDPEHKKESMEKYLGSTHAQDHRK
eukprot:TRINITY_DN33367_c0_g1_i1.p1 TRINITY_DN33367_c0_g1~~TRINITY_DN33367_c0_g1_i1.p1  ORF type:complete len:2069 (+),score=417.13 TRINITY_DN33367_c0_g1_i1:91-6297(+)